MNGIVYYPFFFAPKKKIEEIRGRMLEIDPQLRNNARLQNCLVAWEDAWEPWFSRWKNNGEKWSNTRYTPVI